MRKGIDYIGVGAGAVILNADGKVFLARRGKEARNERHKWEFPGGGVEFGETLEQALIREVKEEFDFSISVGRLLDVVNHIIPDEKQHWVSPTFLCHYVSGTPRIMEPAKCEAIGWFEMDRIPVKDLTIASRKSFDSLRKTRDLSPDLPAGVPMTKKPSFVFPVDSILLIGPTGVGKSPLGDAFASRGLLGRRCLHLDFGSELRRAATVERDTDAYTPDELDFITGVLERGLLLENEHFHLAEKIITLFLNREGFNRPDLLVLNGIPRHEGQAKDIEKIANVHALVVLDCSADDILKRIESNVGGDRTERVDDSVELIGKKLKIFAERTAPLINHYEKKARNIYRLRVTSGMSPEEAYGSVSALAAAHPPVALVAEPPQR